MSRTIFLDSSPVGLITQPNRTAETLAASEWLLRCLRAGQQVIVPAIVYYENRRELLRAQKQEGLARLDAFINATPSRYLPLSDSALRLAAELWAASRKQGLPTASSVSLDIDVILAAQAISSGINISEIIVATANPKHLTRFVPARYWLEIDPDAASAPH